MIRIASTDRPLSMFGYLWSIRGRNLYHIEPTNRPLIMSGCFWVDSWMQSVPRYIHESISQYVRVCMGPFVDAIRSITHPRIDPSDFLRGVSSIAQQHPDSSVSSLSDNKLFQ